MTSNSRYSMLDSMDIRCARCGYENNPQFRFCGMCGAALRPRDPEQPAEDRKADVAREGNIISQRLREHDLPPPEPMPVEPLIAELAAAQKVQAEQTARGYSRESRDESYPQEPFHGQRSPVPVTGPSFLGLSDSGDDRRVEYLLEDEPHPGRMGKIVGTLLVLAIVGGGLFYWRKAGYPWPSSASHTATQSTSTNSTAGSSSPEENGGAMPSEVAPPVAAQQQPEKPKTGVGDVTEASDAATKGAAAAATSSGAQNPGSASPEDKTSDTADNSAEEKTPEAASSPSAEKTTPPTSASAKPEFSKPLASRVRSPKPSPVVSSSPNPAEDSMFLEGQKYLYGTGGVASNCARAQQYLTTSANNNNSKAQSTLATMYATGHCAHRDLPLAYHWFARALHEDPRNTRLERDVQIMWNQMSPQERNLALKNE